MKIRIARQSLTEELFKLQGVVSQRSTLAILSNALLEAADGKLTLHATDLDTSVSTSCECEVLEPGRVTLQAKSFYDIVKNLQEEELELEPELEELGLATEPLPEAELELELVLVPFFPVCVAF